MRIHADSQDLKKASDTFRLLACLLLVIAVIAGIIQRTQPAKALIVMLPWLFIALICEDRKNRLRRKSAEAAKREKRCRDYLPVLAKQDPCPLSALGDDPETIRQDLTYALRHQWLAYGEFDETGQWFFQSEKTKKKSD